MKKASIEDWDSELLDKKREKEKKKEKKKKKIASV